MRTGGCFTWGDEEGVAAWEDAFGNTLVPVWPDAASAAAENEADAEPAERPQRLELRNLAPRLQRWAAQDVLVGVHPLNGNIAGTYSVAQFVRHLLQAVPQGEDANEHLWLPDLAPLV